MASSAIKIDGVAQVSMSIVDAEGRIDKETRKILFEAGKRVRAKQKRLVPKRTRALMKSISIKSRGTKWRRSVEVGPRWSRTSKGQKVATHYGIFVELGTKKMAAQPFVKPSLDGEDQKLAAALADVIRLK